MPGKFDRIKDIAKGLLSPSGAPASAEDMMEKRKKKLDMMGGKKMGGMFDVIYKGRKVREDALKGYDY